MGSPSVRTKENGVTSLYDDRFERQGNRINRPYGARAVILPRG
jgi:hypothetical protein